MKLKVLGTTLWAAVCWASFAPSDAFTAGDAALTVDTPRPGVHYIDTDGDGYGVGSPQGVDADDSDPGVNTPSSVARKHASIAKLLEKLGYRPIRIFYIAPKGNDRTGQSGDPNKPFATFKTVRKLLRPGDAVLFRKGSYGGRYGVGCTKLIGTPERPILIAAFPGERVVLDATVKSLAIDRCQYLIFDGFVLTNSVSTLGSGIGMKFSSHITLRNIESTRHYRGWIGMQDLHHILAERCVFHDNPHSHGVYLGARDKPNSNVTLRKCLIYRNGRHGFQHNGRVSKLLLTDNTIHTNNLAGISLIMGVSHSVVRNNLLFNNNKQGIIFVTYDDAHPNILPYDQCNNVVENNTIWIGRHSWNGKQQTYRYAGVVFKDTTTAQKSRMDNNIFRANTIVTQEGEAFRFSQPRFARSTTIEDNVVYRAAGDNKVMTCGEKEYDFKGFEAVNPKIRNNRFADPKFADVSVKYYRTPGAFDFSRKRDGAREGATSFP